jgi:hypothetical protein
MNEGKRRRRDIDVPDKKARHESLSSLFSFALFENAEFGKNPKKSASLLMNANPNL